MRISVAVAVASIAASTFAQTPPAVPAAPPITIHRTTGPIVIDGDLADAGWQDAARVDAFVETSPGNNVPARVKTTAYLAYDDRYFYIGIRAEDPEPKKIRAPYVERDGVIGTDDNIAVFLDTRGDRRMGLELRVNPRGIQADGFYDDAGPVEDFSPDYFYDTAAKIDAGGWSAEYRIPFSSLRYSSRNPTWNILIWRNYPRDFRYAFDSAPVPRGSNCLVCHAVPLVGLENLPESGHFTAAPYVTGQSLSQPSGPLGTPLDHHALDTNAGADVKWTPSGTGAVDLTINPDFSQVEADVPQITVNQRFAVFYPEKRPFFLEGFDLFNTPLQVAYTRTITSPRGGLRATGRIGDTAYTLLVAEDRGGGLTILPGPLGNGFAPQDFRSTDTIARLRHEMGSSFIGAVLTDREVSGGGHNRVIGPDVLWRPNDSDTVTSQLLVSDTTNPNRPDLSPEWTGQSLRSHAFRASWDHVVTKYDYGASVNDIGNDFRADLGFIPQVGYREAVGYAGLRFYPEHSLFSFIRPSILVDQQDDLHGNTLFRQLSIGANANGARNLQAGFLVRPGEKVLVGNDLLQQSYATWFLQIDPSRRFTRIAMQVRQGQSIDFANGRVGNGPSAQFTAIFRPIDRTTFELDVNREWLNAAGGPVYTAQVERLRALYSFTANSLVRVIAQYNDVNRNQSRYISAVPQHSGAFLGSILYSYKLNWQTVLFAGYGDDRTLTVQNDLLKQDRSLFFKVSYAIQR
ncbi:MAG TPA: DUF5916 domain-containing protein [Thermoanaerobaculia bacterium]|nr:DUF5916 domain-containing protein [Thermoanaerobaculia bacterium]